MVDELSEERAEHWCERLAREEPSCWRPRGEKDVEALLAILARPVADEDPEWTAEDFLRSLEENRVAFREPGL